MNGIKRKGVILERRVVLVTGGGERKRRKKKGRGEACIHLIDRDREGRKRGARGGVEEKEEAPYLVVQSKEKGGKEETQNERAGALQRKEEEKEPGEVE